MKLNALRVSAIATAMMIVWLRIQGATLITTTSPRGIVDLELADSSDRLMELMTAWNKSVAINNILIDFLFIPAYASLIALCCRYLSEKFPDTRLPHIGMQLAKAIWLAALLDVVENLLMLCSLNGFYSPTSLQLTCWIATIKFLLVGLALLYILVLFFKLILKKILNGA